MELTGLSLAQVLGVLAGFGAAVLALYFLRPRRRSVDVPFVQLWDQVLADQRTTRLFSSLKQILSLLVALTFVALVALATGDPRAAGASRAGRTELVLIDVSASMGARDASGRSRIEAALEAVRSRIAALGPNDRMILAQMGASTVPLGAIESEASALEAALTQVAARDVAADLSRGLHWALDTAEGIARAEIVVVSDGSLGAEPVLPSVSARIASEGVPVRWHRVGEPGRNVAITAFAVRRYPIDKTRAQVLVELWNPGAEAEDVELTLLGDGAPLEVSTLRIGAGERMPRIYDDVTGADRTLEARIRMADGTRDALAADDAAYARLPERRRARVVVVASGDIYLSAALLLDEYLDVVEVEPAAFPPEGEFDVAIFESFVPSQPYPADTIWLHPQGDGASRPFEITGTIERPFFDRLARDHPLLQFTSLRDVNIAEALEVEVRPGDTVVGGDERGPLLITGTRDGHRMVALTFDPRRSDLPLRIAFPLLLLNAIDLFVEEQSGFFSSYRTGETWQVPVGDAASAALIDPEGRERPVPITMGRAVCTGELAGFYTLRTDRGEEVLAANLGPNEEAVLAIPETLGELGAPSPRPVISSVSIPSEPWMWLVLAAFVLLAIEWATFHRRWTL